MKKNLIIFMIVFIFFSLFQGYAEDSENTFGIKFALMFYLPNLLDADNYYDGFQTGAGVKMWIIKSFAVRALVHIDHERNDEFETSVTTFGLSGAVEYHFSPKKLSPYAGGLVGYQSMATKFDDPAIDDDLQSTIYVGGFFGVEMELYKSISLFGEYALILESYDTGYTLEFGTASEGLIGLLIYF